MDTEYGHAPPEAGQAYLGMLAIDSLLGVSAALETLTDRALGPEGSEGGVLIPLPRFVMHSNPLPCCGRCYNVLVTL